MEYDFRNRTGTPYDTQSPIYGRPATGAPHPHPMYGQAPGQYPRVGQHSGGRNPPFHHNSSPSSNSGIVIRVAIKPEYRITPPPQLSTLVGDIPRSTFNFDFDLEKKILAEAEKGSLNWSTLGLENLPSRMPERTNMVKTRIGTSVLGKMMEGSTGDPSMNKYAGSGFSREAVAIAVANYGDNPVKVKEFADGYALLKEMGFPSNSVADALLLNENDKDKALAHLLANSS